MAALLKVGFLATLQVGEAAADDGPLDEVLRLLLPGCLVLEIVVSFD